MTIFYNIESAQYFADKLGGVVLFGDCPEFWVVPPDGAERLIAGGYEAVDVARPRMESCTE
jgi:hypothetical protein